jgi:glycosyltransferase involved in cell wall biosynthesis
MSVALVSLYPLDATGGGELYTVETAQSIVASGELAIIAAPVDIPPARADLATRLQTKFVWTDPAGDALPATIAWSDLLVRLTDYDRIWVHQYLGADLVFDLIASTASDQELLFTSLGFEPLRDLFADIYQPCSRQYFVEISAYAARRATVYAPQARWVHAAIWRRELRPVDWARPPARREYLALGRVLPHKGLETTIDAVTADDVLHIVGPTPDEEYSAFLRHRARGKPVRFHGCLARPDVQQLLEETTGLISASTHQLFDGRRIEQPELLGLVLCEALRDGTLPVASDVPAFREVMGAVGLQDWTFHEGDAAGLRSCMGRLSAMAPDDRQTRIQAARAALAARFAWDDYWPRVRAQIEDEVRLCA